MPRVPGMPRHPALTGFSYDHDVDIPVGSLQLTGHLTLPTGTAAIVVFVHGSGSSRHSPRNRLVADALNRAGLGTLLFDLLTVEEARDRANVFNIELLATRLQVVTRWLRRLPETEGLAVGYFGASTGAAAALWAASAPDSHVAAVVSRGGRPDLAAPRLAHVEAPTRLIVGADDTAVLDLNRRAHADMRCARDLVQVPGATHLFEEPGALDRVADLACDWFVANLTTAV